MLDKMLLDFGVFVSNISPRLSKMQSDDILSGLFDGNIYINSNDSSLRTPYVEDRVIYFPETFLNFLWSVCFYSITITEELTVERKKPEFTGGLKVTGVVDQAHRMINWALSLRLMNRPWPTGICDPYEEGKYQYFVGLVFKNALAFILFHEYAHVKLKHRADASQSVLIAQETEADNFALQTVYEEISNDDDRLLYLLGVICAGATMLYAVTDPSNVAQENHPDIDVRLFNFIEFFELPESNERRYIHLMLTVVLRGFIYTYGLDLDQERKFQDTWDQVKYLASIIEAAKENI